MESKNRTNTESNVEMTPMEKRLSNLKRDAGPGRPIGQRNYATIYRAALEKLALADGRTPEELEDEMISSGILSAKKGNHRFYADVLDRLYGKPTQKLEMEGKLTISTVLDNLENENRQSSVEQRLENEPSVQDQGQGAEAGEVQEK